MNTQDLIRAVVADNAHVEPPVARTLLLALVPALLAAAGFYMLVMELRSDFWWSIVHSPRFQFKFLYTAAIALTAFLLARRLSRPEESARGLIWLLAIPAVMIASGVAVELYLVPADHWSVYAIGQNAVACTLLIPLLSLAPLVAVFYALRGGAPSNPALAGAMGGLLSAALGAFLYASHCVDDSPLFVSIWYTIGMSAVTLAGAALGARLLKW